MLSKRLTMEDMQLIVQFWLAWKTLLQMEDTPGQGIKGQGIQGQHFLELHLVFLLSFFVAFEPPPN